MDETAGRVVGVSACRAVARRRLILGAACPASPHRDDMLLRQFQADFETFRQGAEQGRSFPGQDPGQPMSHAHQDVFASARGLVFALPEGLMGKHGLGAAGEFVRERFRDGCPKIIARLIPCRVEALAKTGRRARPDTADNNWFVSQTRSRSCSRLNPKG